MFWDDRKVVQEMIHKLVYSTWMTLQTYPSVRASCMYTLTVEVFLWILKTTVIPHNFGSATRYMRFKNLYVQKLYNIALEQTPNPVQQPVYVSDFYFYLGVLFWGGLGVKNILIIDHLKKWRDDQLGGLGSCKPGRKGFHRRKHGVSSGAAPHRISAGSEGFWCPGKHPRENQRLGTQVMGDLEVRWFFSFAKLVNFRWTMLVFPECAPWEITMLHLQITHERKGKGSEPNPQITNVNHVMFFPLGWKFS